MGSSYRYIFLLLLLITARYASAQSPPSSDSRKDPYIQNANFNPSMAIVIVVLISAFFFLGFFSIYIRNCTGYSLDPRPTRGGGVGTAAAARSRRQCGINPEVLFTFPTFVFSEVKAHKIGKSALECAVCLCEFEDDETLRLLPKCDHVFHADCIDAWLASHVTCPVCRCNLKETDAAAPAVVVPVQEPPVQETPVQVGNQQVTLLVRDEEDGEERKAEIESLERFINMKRSKSRAARPARFPRSHSTGHSLVFPGENLERFTLRLPENVRREVLQTTTSGKGLPREGSSRRAHRSEEGSTGRARSMQLGSSRSERWGSFLVRTLSVKNWGRRGDGVELSKGGGIFRRGESIKGERSVKGKSYRRGDSVKFEAPTSSMV